MVYTLATSKLSINSFKLAFLRIKSNLPRKRLALISKRLLIIPNIWSIISERP
jgi:hypothetical protein